ncbi:MMPL family transporter [bacterium]|nr:MMPL family transporter [bacterium]
MFFRFGQQVARYWPVVLLVWLGAVVTAGLLAPPLDRVAQTGEFAFLPEDSPSRTAERQFAAAFPDQAQASTIAIVARRAADPLQPADLDFIDDGHAPDTPEADTDLVDQIRAILTTTPPVSTTEAASPAEKSEIEITTYRDRSVGKLLRSDDGHATLIIVNLPTEFMDAANSPTIHAIESRLFYESEFLQQVPKGLELYLSGTAVVGRDMLQTARDSAKATEHLTIILVIALLILIYRAPLLALVPLITVFVSVKLTMSLLCLMAAQGWVILFTGIESYVTVLLYGAGVDYCLFLIARYKEEIDGGIVPRTALVDSLGYVGAAIAASAGTVICGIGMMIFAEFGKFHDAGIAISFGLVIVLCASLTLTPALLCSTGVHVFWPQHRVIGQSAPAEAAHGLQKMWDTVSHLLLKRAGWLWLGCLAFMIPFGLVGAWFYSDLSYGLLSDLPKTARSVVGTNVVRGHFPDGLTGPITVLVDAPDLDFADLGEAGGIEVIDQFHLALKTRHDEFGLADVRSVAFPLGGDQGLLQIQSEAQTLRERAELKETVRRSKLTYVSGSDDDQPAHLTRLELITSEDPFAQNSIRDLARLEEKLPEVWEKVSNKSARFYLLGPTASIRDLKTVTDRDQVRIDLLVTCGVFTILVVLLRQPAICVYLILSVLLSYLVTLGVTYLAFWVWDGTEFAGLDWKVPMFLFTILIAVGEDYNIFLMSRVAEEQAKRGRVAGILHALTCTGRIISSCGIIMAGTFASLAAGSLKGMSQLGFALAFGVLLDTFVVRPILVPAYLVLIESGRWGRASRWLGGHPEADTLETAQSTIEEPVTEPAA